jgi:hypothetical protein
MEAQLEMKAENQLISAHYALFLLCFPLVPPFPLIFSGFSLFISNWEVSGAFCIIQLIYKKYQIQTKYNVCNSMKYLIVHLNLLFILEQFETSDFQSNKCFLGFLVIFYVFIHFSKIYLRLIALKKGILNKY